MDIDELQADVNELQKDKDRLENALRTLDRRLRECMDQPITVDEAYDSFYQDLIQKALNQ